MQEQQVKNFGDVRRMILDTIVDLRAGNMSASVGMAVAASFKVLNDNVQVEINATKLALATREEAHSFGKVVKMGQLLISGNSDQPPA